MRSILHKYPKEKSSQVRELMHWAMLSLDEDGCAVEQPEKWRERLAAFRRMHPLLLTMEESLQSFVYRFPHFYHRVWLRLEKDIENAGRDGLSLKQLTTRKLEMVSFHTRWTKKLSRMTDDLIAAMEWDKPLVQAKGYYFDDIAKKIEDVLLHGNGEILGDLVNLLKRKIEAVQSLDVYWDLDDAGFTRKMKDLRRRKDEHLGRLIQPPDRFLRAAKWHSVDKDDLRECWMNAFEQVLRKLGKGNLDLLSCGDPVVLTEGIAANLVKQFVKARPWMDQIEEDEADDDAVSPFGSALWDEGLDQTEAEQLEREATTISFKLGFDFLSLIKKEKPILYLGFLIQHDYVPDEEIALVKQALGLAPDQKIDQEVILRELGLEIGQSSLSKRLWGDKKETGRAYGILYKWVNYSCWARNMLLLSDYKPGQEDLQVFFDSLSYFELSRKEEGPDEDESWYESLYRKLRTGVLKMSLSKGFTPKLLLN